MGERNIIIRLWSPTGKARGTSMKIPSYAKASEGYPPVAKSAEAVQHIDIDASDTTYAFIHGQARGLLRRRIKPRTEDVAYLNLFQGPVFDVHDQRPVQKFY